MELGDKRWKLVFSDGGAKRRHETVEAGRRTHLVEAIGKAKAERPPADRLARLGRYEVHLDRKLERMLAMLQRLKDLRQGMVAG